MLKYQLPLCLVAILASLKLLIIMDLIFNRPKRKDPRWRYKERKISGHYTKLVLRSRTLRDTETFKDFLRMTPETFDSLLRLIGPSLLRQDTKMKEAISPSERLAVTLRYLATGMYFFLIGKLVERSTIVRGCAIVYCTILQNIFFQETICVLPHVLGVFWPS